jgi:hypothetical protein
MSSYSTHASWLHISLGWLHISLGWLHISLGWLHISPGWLHISLGWLQISLGWLHFPWAGFIFSWAGFKFPCDGFIFPGLASYFPGSPCTARFAFPWIILYVQLAIHFPVSLCCSVTFYIESNFLRCQMELLLFMNCVDLAFGDKDSMV